MRHNDLDILIQEGEGTTLEFKESLSSSFARELVAFANTIGGKILLGVRDDGSIVGVQDTNALRARVQDIARNCDPPVRVRAEPVGDVFAVHVKESDAKPVQCTEGFFWRQGAVTQKLTRNEIRGFFRLEGVVRFDLSPCPRFKYPDDFDQGKFNRWLGHRPPSGGGCTGQHRGGRKSGWHAALSERGGALLRQERTALLSGGLHHLLAGPRHRQGSHSRPQGL